MGFNGGFQPNRDSRDGIPIFWIPEAPRFSGVLMFRVGWADEMVANRGTTHLVEHLILRGFGRKPPYEMNGIVDGLRSMFWATGTPGEVASFMRGICRSIQSFSMDGLETECRILRTEGLGHQPSLVDRLKWLRFGAQGHGLNTVPEFLFEAPDPAAVRAWAAERFTAENAVAWFSGPIPDDLGFEALPRGRRWPCPEPTPIVGLKVPTFVHSDPGGIGIGFVSERKNWIGVSWKIARDRLMERLRYREGLTYVVQSELHHLTADSSHSTLWAGCLPEHVQNVQLGFLEILEDLGQRGPTVEELAQSRTDWERAVVQPEYRTQELESDAFNSLIGQPVYSTDELFEEFDARDPATWASGIRVTYETAFLMLPPGCASLRLQWQAYPLFTQPIAAGRRFRSTTQRYPWSKKGLDLLVGKQGISLLVPQGGAVTVRYEDVAGAVMHANGTLQVFGTDGFVIALSPEQWRHGGDACSEVMRALPSERLLVVPAR